MKNLSLWSVLLIITLFFSSCNEDSLIAEADKQDNTHLLMRGTELPDNINNTFDIAGQLHIELTEGYLLTHPKAIPIENTITIVELIANLNPSFLSLRPYGYVLPTANRVEHIINNENEVINNLSISSSAKLALSHFIENLMLYQKNNTEFSVVYSYIVDYETDVMLNNSYNEMDKRTLLTTSSIARHAMHFKRKRKKPRDRDWDISWGSIIAGSSGSEESLSQAVFMSTVAGINLNVKK